MRGLAGTDPVFTTTVPAAMRSRSEPPVTSTSWAETKRACPSINVTASTAASMAWLRALSLSINVSRRFTEAPNQVSGSSSGRREAA
jgi:hypothetical protein